ncbi:hypothetical protein NTGM5_510002 [Candidatus Nitrotoga sp. M5]|nr:hypothetical protein NTGM5_510002 [Candidatus Nitrotoga sp. M5]
MHNGLIATQTRGLVLGTVVDATKEQIGFVMKYMTGNLGEKIAVFQRIHVQVGDTPKRAILFKTSIYG